MLADVDVPPAAPAGPSRGMEVLFLTPPAGPRQREVVRIYREPARWERGEGAKRGRQNLEEKAIQNLEERAVGTNIAYA